MFNKTFSNVIGLLFSFYKFLQIIYFNDKGILNKVYNRTVENIISQRNERQKNTLELACPKISNKIKHSALVELFDPYLNNC